MNNPFEVLEAKLNTIDRKLDDFMRQTIKSQQPLSDKIGGIDLAEKITGLKRPTLYALVSAKKIPVMKRGKKLYFSCDELTAWIREGRRKTHEEIVRDAVSFLPQKNGGR